MSILIRGMEMPTSGQVIAIYKLQGKFYASANGTELCPLIEIPPHGRLIDADALDIYRREEQAWHEYEQNQDNEYFEGVKDGLHEAAKQLSIAPTIIPAEEVQDDKR